MPRVVATPAALAVIESLRQEHGALIFHQSGGCCDGSAPMCFPAGEFLIGDSDVRLGEIGGAPFYMSAAQFEYWQHTQLTIDVVPGNGGLFSVERPTGLRFLTRSRLYTDEENAWLERHPVIRPLLRPAGYPTRGTRAAARLPSPRSHLLGEQARFPQQPFCRRPFDALGHAAHLDRCWQGNAPIVPSLRQ